MFTQFREMGLLLQRHLGDRGQLDGPTAALAGGVPFLHGGVTRAGRQRMVERFQGGEGPPILLVSLKAGGTGLNLTAASQVIHYDRWWNPAVEDQATDRAWRLGQDRTVLVHKLVCEGTLEERIAELIDEKRSLAVQRARHGRAVADRAVDRRPARARGARARFRRGPAVRAPGADPASHLVSTMLDVLVAEMAEPGRVRRGRAYALQGAVGELRIEPGLVTAHVQGSSPRPYVATARVPLVEPDGPRLAALLPDRSQLRFTCTCPDDDLPCKHAVAVMAAFSERVAYDGRLFVLWRTGIEPSKDGVASARPSERHRRARRSTASVGGTAGSRPRTIDDPFAARRPRRRRSGRAGGVPR